MLQGLLANFMVVALSISIWIHVQPWLEGSRRLRSRLVFALIMGAGVATSIVLSQELTGGLRIDLRSSLLMVAGFVGGPVAALVTAAVAIATRNVFAGPSFHASVMITTTAVLAAACSPTARHGRPTFLTICTVGCISGAIPIAGLLMAKADVAQAILDRAGWHLFAFNAAATIISCLALLRARRASEVLHLQRAAIIQSPDLLYVKDLRGRIRAANLNVASITASATPTT